MADVQEGRGSRTTVAAIVVGLAVMLTVLLAVFVGGRFPSRKLTTTAYFANSGGLKSGASVNLNGVAIGTVKSVTLTTSPLRRKTPVQVVMKLDRAHQAELHTDSTATIVGSGALGDTAVDIDSRGAVGPELRDGDDLKAVVDPSVVNAKAFQATTNNMNLLIGRFNGVVDQMETGNGSIGQLLSNPGLTNEAKGTVSRAKELATKLSANRSTVGKFVNDRGVTDKIASISTNVQGLNASLAKLTAGPLQDNLAATGTHVNSLQAQVNAGKGGVGMLMTDSAAKKDLSAATQQANALMAGINAGKGSAGKFVKGGEVNVDLTKFEAETSALATMIRKNPTKYLTIEVRIF